MNQLKTFNWLVERSNRLESAESEIAALRSELEEARKDSGRLDFLDTTGWQAIGRAVNQVNPKTGFQTWREAIDGMRVTIERRRGSGKD